MTTYKNYINGEWVDASSSQTFQSINPADSADVVGTFPLSSTEDVDRAVRAARQAFKSWRLVPAPKRGDILARAEKLLIEHKEELAHLATREMGKILDETRGDVQEAIDTAFYMAGEGSRLFGQTVPSELPNKFAMSVRTPMGVAGMITPWNFPVAIPSWKALPALICGNTVVIKPSSDAPATAARFVEILAEAGFPKGVINLVFGSGSEAGAALADHPEVNVISFTGSSQTGSQLAERCGKELKRLSLEMGGKNAQIVMDDANLELALEGALWGAFGTTGQRCTATSRLIVHEKVIEQFTRELVKRAQTIRIGSGLDSDTQMGPLINQKQLDKVTHMVKVGVEEDKAELLCGGQRHKEAGCDKGYFFKPTIFGNCQSRMRICQEEIFGPVLAIIPCKNLEQAVDILNDTAYGLSSSIYTQDVNRAFQAMRDMYAGITYINGPTIGAETRLPFGGTGHTGNGHRESGTAVLETFCEWKSVYVDYSGTLQRAQIDNS